MGGVFDDEEIEQVVPRPDTELTLGTTALLVIFFGLLALCGLCFGMGYSMGHRGAQENAAALPSPANASTAHADSARTKPSANTEASAVSRPDPPATQQASSSSGAFPQNSSAAGAVGSSIASRASVQSVQPVSTKPALGATASPVQASVPASTVHPALQSAPSLMVQIAAVSQPEDADVLTSALRKRGYAVAAHREPLDGLIHVRIGPFKTRDEADVWRQKLLNDGYNAIVQP
jgi:DedD protein